MRAKPIPQSVIKKIAARADSVWASGQFDQEVPSPCVGICQMDEAQAVCRGCLRTLDEIADWAGATPAQRRAVWASLGQRAHQRLNPTGGRPS